MNPRHLLWPSLVFAAGMCLLSGAVSTTSPRFYQDDPISREPESQDASRATESEIGDLLRDDLQPVRAAGATSRPVCARRTSTLIEEVPRLELVHRQDWDGNGHDRRGRPRSERRGSPDPSRWVIFREKTSGAHPGRDGEGRQGRNLVPRVRPALLPGSGHRCRRHGDEVLLGARLQPGRVVPDDLRSEARGVRSEGDASPAERQAHAVHARRPQRDPRETSPASPTAPTASSPAVCCQARSSATSATRARARRSERSRAARAPPRAARAARVRRVDEPDGPQGARTRSTRSRPRTVARS